MPLMYCMYKRLFDVLKSHPTWFASPRAWHNKSKGQIITMKDLRLICIPLPEFSAQLVKSLRWNINAAASQNG